VCVGLHVCVCTCLVRFTEGRAREVSARPAPLPCPCSSLNLSPLSPPTLSPGSEAAREGEGRGLPAVLWRMGPGGGRSASRSPGGPYMDREARGWPAGG
jgi:hypothetical protein